MRKGLALFAASLLAVTAATLGACKEDEGPSTFEPTFGDAGDPTPPPPGTFVPEGGTALNDAGKPPLTKCDVKIPEGFTPTWKAPQKTSACDATELEGYYDACLAKVEDTASCEAWRAAHDACTKCIEPADKSGPIQWHLERTYVTLNLAGCIGLADTTTKGAECAEAFDAVMQCTRAACEYCFAEGGTYPLFQSCQTAARGTGVCQSLENTRQTKCGGVSGTSGTANTCYLLQGDTEKAHFVRVQGLFCGP